MSAANPLPTVAEPFPIFKLAHRFLIYDVNTVTHIRREHNICGVLMGSLPQASQQNVFLGLPLELMPEDVRLLVEKGVAYVVDDVAAHKQAFLPGPPGAAAASGLSPEERKAYAQALRKQGQAAAKDASDKSEDRKTAALKKQAAAANGATENWNDIPDDMLMPSARSAKGPRKTPRRREAPSANPTNETNEDYLLFTSSDPVPDPVLDNPLLSDPPLPSTLPTDPEPYAITPTTSHPPLSTPAHLHSPSPIAVPPSYPLYRHLHANGYFMTPGLRFGCQYTAYPGDPLRFHSHFLANGLAWDQPFELLSLVGGGRLGTGVKKGFLIGGEVPPSSSALSAPDADPAEVRAFCIEWGGM